MRSMASKSVILVAFTLAACGETTTPPGLDPLRDLPPGEVEDIAGQLQVPTGANGSFAFHGYVLTPPTTFSGPGMSDSLNTWPRVPNVVITTYKFLGRGDDLRPIAGESLGSVTTDANGYFRFDTALPDGEYVLAAVPPQGSALKGFYWTFHIRADLAGRLLGIVLQ